MKRIFTKFLLLLTVLATGLATDSRGQLGLGDVLFTSFDSRGGSATTDIFSFVLLAPVANNTPIRFTDRGYNGSSWNADNGGSESSIQWVSNAAYPIGTEIKITGLTATLGTSSTNAGTVTAVTGTLGLSLAALDQIIAYRGAGDVSTASALLAGIHWNNCSGNTTDANWDIVGPCATVGGVNGSTIPPGLSPSFSSIWAGLTGGVANVAGRFECTGTPSASVSDLRTAILNRSVNWTFIANPANALSVPAGCNYYGVAAPVFGSNPSNATVCVGGNTTFSASASNSPTYQWQVSTTGVGGTFNDLSNTAPYSNVTSTTLNITGATTGMNGYAYRLSATNGGGTVYSSPAVLTVQNGNPTFSVQPSDATICPNGSTILSGSATGGTVTYQWQVNTGSGFTNLSNSSVYSNVTTSSLTITGAPTSGYGYQYRLGATNICGTTYSNAATLTFRTNWTGATNADWLTATNWSCNAVPDGNTDVVIPNVATQPVASTTAPVARNVTINSGSSITVAASGTLTINGDVINLGTLTASAAGARLSFGGSSSQAIPAGTFANITVAGGSNKTLSGNLSITENLSFTSGKILLGANTLTMSSTGTVGGASTANYVVTNGTGVYKKLNVGTSSVAFPIGTTSSYTPFEITNSGTPDNFNGRVIDGVYNGYSGETPTGSSITTNVVNKTWFITEDIASGSVVALTVQWNLSDELPSFSRTGSILAHYTGGSWSPKAPAAATGSNPYQTSRTGINSFSPFGVGGIGSPLPVRLISFNGQAKDAGVDLSWKVADEKNIDAYIVERSADGRTFTAIGTVKATGSGNYGFTDRDAAGQGKLYYRLNILDLNGISEFSGLITVDPGKNASGAWTISPNPVSGNELTIRPGASSAELLDVTIVDLTGKVWRKAAGQGANSIAVDIRSLPAGAYLVKLRTAKSVETVKLQRLQ